MTFGCCKPFNRPRFHGSMVPWLVTKWRITRNVQFFCPSCKSSWAPSKFDWPRSLWCLRAQGIEEDSWHWGQYAYQTKSEQHIVRINKKNIPGRKEANKKARKHHFICSQGSCSSLYQNIQIETFSGTGIVVRSSCISCHLFGSGLCSFAHPTATCVLAMAWTGFENQTHTTFLKCCDVLSGFRFVDIQLKISRISSFYVPLSPGNSEVHTGSALFCWRVGQLVRYDTVHHFIKPATLKRKCSYVELVAEGPQLAQWLPSLFDTDKTWFCFEKCECSTVV